MTSIDASGTEYRLVPGTSSYRSRVRAHMCECDAEVSGTKRYSVLEGNEVAR